MIEPYYDQDGITIYHADCRDVFTQTDADVLVTDPPYGISHSSNRDGTAAWRGARSIVGDETTELRDWVLGVWQPRPALVFGTWKVPVPTGAKAVVVWDKCDAGSGDLSIPWKPSHEQIYVIGSGFSGHRGPGVLRHVMQTHVTQGRTHPHEKPLALMRDLIAKCPAGVVIDPFMGSGTTLRAAKDLGRRAIGIEVEERYCEIAVERLRQGVLL